MAATLSSMLPLGTTAPDFALLDTVTGLTRSFDDLKGEQATLVMFICNHCPFVKHVDAELVRLANDYLLEGVGFVAISSNDVEHYPQDAPELMTAEAESVGYPFAYLYDETQEVAKAFEAACTPDFFLFDSEDKLVYRGQLDDSRPGNGEPVNGRDLRAAINAVLTGQPVSAEQKPSMGCNIKWKS